jgi:hypothetical protein
MDREDKSKSLEKLVTASRWRIATRRRGKAE